MRSVLLALFIPLRFDHIDNLPGSAPFSVNVHAIGRSVDYLEKHAIEGGRPCKLFIAAHRSRAMQLGIRFRYGYAAAKNLLMHGNALIGAFSRNEGDGAVVLAIARGRYRDDGGSGMLLVALRRPRFLDDVGAYGKRAKPHGIARKLVAAYVVTLHVRRVR